MKPGMHEDTLIDLWALLAKERLSRLRQRLVVSSGIWLPMEARPIMARIRELVDELESTYE